MKKEEIDPTHTVPAPLGVDHTMRFLLGRRFSQICSICAVLSLAIFTILLINIYYGYEVSLRMILVIVILVPIASIFGVIAGVIALCYRSARSGRYLAYSVIGLLMNIATLYLIGPQIVDDSNVIEETNKMQMASPRKLSD